MSDVQPIEPTASGDEFGRDREFAPGETDAVAIVEVQPDSGPVDPEDPRQLLLSTLLGHADSNKWVGSPFEAIKRISNTKVGSVGQDFLEALTSQLGIRTRFPVNAQNERAKQSPWDIELEGITFELKTATEDVKASFQFNHIRYHRPYDAVICIGVTPDSIYFGMWSKAEVATGKAGTLVSMEKGANASYKLTKRRNQLIPIEEFPVKFEAFVHNWNSQK